MCAFICYVFRNVIILKLWYHFLHFKHHFKNCKSASFKLI